MKQIYIRFKNSQRLVSWFLTSCLLLAFNSVSLDLFALAATEKIDDESVRIDEVAIEGIIHTKPEVIIRLEDSLISELLPPWNGGRRKEGA